MSDYYGNATLEDWLAEEVFHCEKVPATIVERFEKWRHSVELDIERWMETDDGEGNNTSWRGWGRGFNGIPDEDDPEFGAAIRLGMNEMNAKKLDKQQT